MTDNPCKKELEEFRKATIELTQAADAVKAYTAFEPLTAYQDIEKMSPEYIVRMDLAFKKEEDAKKKYRARFQSWIEYHQKHK